MSCGVVDVLLEFSAALCRGLIEANGPGPIPAARACGFPRLYAAASLKPPSVALVDDGPDAFSAALCRGLIEAIIFFIEHC